jgi:hypothetical protein
MRKLFGKLFGKWELIADVIPFLLIILAVKAVAHHFQLEFLELNAMFGALISANVFLIGFMMSGLLMDYKESEKIPGELACSAETIADECFIVHMSKRSEAAQKGIQHTKELLDSIIDWFYKRVRTTQLMDKISGYNAIFQKLESETQPTFLNRLKQEQHVIRRLITRAHTIRETNFVVAGYAIVQAATFLLILGMIFIRMEPYYESLFFVSFVSFFLIYMIMFLQDLDNPFAYYERENMIDEISLQPIFDMDKRIKTKLEELK